MTETPEPAPKAKKRRKLSLKKKLAFACVMAGAFLLLFEVCLRVLGYPKGIVRSLSHVWSPDPAQQPGLYRPGKHRVSFPTDLAYDLGVNSLGLRGEEITKAKPDGTLRVLCMGDSVTFGYYVDDEETYPHYLQESLRKQGRDVQVINGGCGHSSIVDQRLYCTERLLALQPDVVVVQFCSNDVTPRELLRDPPQYRNIASGDAAKTQWYRKTAIGEAQLMLRIELKQWSRERSGEWPPTGFPSAGPGFEVGEELWQTYEKELLELKATLDKAGIPLILTVFTDLNELEINASRYDKRLAMIAKKHGIPYRCVLGAYSKAEDFKSLYLWPLDPHPSKAGNRVYAAEVEAVLREAGVLK